MKITFYGAAGEVTGSKHLLEVGSSKVLLDCGMFQGKFSEAEEKNRQFAFAPQEIDAVVLSHAHLDHCGSLPLLYKQGFRGKIFATPATRQVAELIMLDSAKIQQQDRSFYAELEGREPLEPLYSEVDVKNVLHLFVDIPYHQSFAVAAGVRGYFRDAGHILGSAVVELTLSGQERSLKLGFTGDLGRPNMPIIRDPEVMEDLDVLISESTYGGSVHEGLSEAKRILKKYVKEAFARRGKMIVPSFALERTQELVYLLHEMIDNKEIPRFPIYVDSPLAVDITEVFRRNAEYFDQETFATFGKSDDPFGFRNLKYIHSISQSKALNKKKGPMMIIASAGMCEGGRVKHHLRHSVDNRNNMIFIVGYMARGTLGREIVEQKPEIEIFGEKHKLRAQVIVLNSLSAHADSVDLVNYISAVGDSLKRIFLVHGEDEQAQALKEKLQSQNKGYQIDIPQMGEGFVI